MELRSTGQVLPYQEVLTSGLGVPQLDELRLLARLSGLSESRSPVTHVP
ncbi:hypothetical protein FBY31_4508 [Arthrobacter sp. SLBN-100]|nr:hypothetical protein FBY31_4508 [Arthrobacter sp. SLBN-100]